MPCKGYIDNGHAGFVKEVVVLFVWNLSTSTVVEGGGGRDHDPLYNRGVDPPEISRFPPQSSRRYTVVLHLRQTGVGPQ